MKTIIAGGRDITDRALAERAIKRARFHITEVVCGDCRGVDQIGAEWAEAQGIPVKKFPADWNKDGNAAGPIRNRRMAEYANQLIAVWDGESKGTHNMIQEASARHLEVYVEFIGKPKFDHYG